MRKVFAIFLIFLMLLFSSVYFFKDSIAKWILEREIEQSESLAKAFSYGDLHVALAGKKVEFTAVKYHNAQKGIFIELDKFLLKGLSLYDLFQKSGYHVDSVIIVKPKVRYLMGKQDSDAAKSQDLNLNIDYLSIQHGNVNLSNDSGAAYYFTNIGIDLNGVNVIQNESESSFRYEAFEATADSITHDKDKKSIKLSELSLSKENRLNIGSVKIYSKDENVRRNSETSASIHNLSMHILTDSLIRNRAIYSNSANIDSFYVLSEVHQYPVDDANVRPKMFNEIIKSVPQLKLVKELTFEKGKVDYKEHQANSENVINVSFDKMEGTFEGVGQGTEENEIADLKIEADFMNACHMKANIKFNLLSDIEEHQIQGEIKPFKLAQLNPLFKQISPFELEGGAVSNFTFNFRLNDDRSNGTLNLFYEDLKISSYKDEADVPKSQIALFLTNTFVVRNNNLKDDDPEKGKISFERAKEKSMFNYWWKSLFSGFKDVIINT